MMAGCDCLPVAPGQDKMGGTIITRHLALVLACLQPGRLATGTLSAAAAQQLSGGAAGGSRRANLGCSLVFTKGRQWGATHTRRQAGDERAGSPSDASSDSSWSGCRRRRGSTGAASIPTRIASRGPEEGAAATRPSSSRSSHVTTPEREAPGSLSGREGRREAGAAPGLLPPARLLCHTAATTKRGGGGEEVRRLVVVKLP